MRVTPALLNALCGLAAIHIDANPIPDQVIGRGVDDDPYMQRWMLIRKAEGGPIENLYLHRFMRSDREDRHDHPWASMTVLLRGSYREDTPEGSFLRQPGDVVMRPADAIHAITEVEPDTISLFITGPKVREWGFHTAHGFLPWQDFREYMNRAAQSVEDAQRFASAARFERRNKPERVPGAMVFGGHAVFVVAEDGRSLLMKQVEATIIENEPQEKNISEAGTN